MTSCEALSASASCCARFSVMSKSLRPPGCLAISNAPKCSPPGKAAETSTHSDSKGKKEAGYFPVYFMSGRPPLLAFSSARYKASSLRLLPTLYRSCHMRPASPGLSMLCTTASGIDRPPCVFQTLFLARHPLCQASLTRAIRPLVCGSFGVSTDLVLGLLHCLASEFFTIRRPP